MKISLRWLQEFLPFAGSSTELAEAMTASGMEVASVETRGASIDRVVVARIAAFGPHPNADRLSVCQVEDGSPEIRQIVCGAKNFRAGDKVPLALPGAVLPGDFKIKASNLRGVRSEGMLCSAKELRLSEEAAGLLILPPEAPVGAPLSAIYPPDAIFDVELTPDRPDLLSYVGIARELAAVLRIAPTLPASAAPFPFRHGAGARAEGTTDCPFALFQRFRGVRVGPSPAWLSERLEASGLRAINNLVDVTNYVMLERGKPIHVYDAAKVSGPFCVRRARAGETLLALDGRTYHLGPEQLTIADDASVLGLAGVIGGESSGVTSGTTDIWLENAYFDPGCIRAGGRSLGLLTDASFRFERGVDPAAVVSATQRAADLIVQVAGGEPDGEPWAVGEPPPTRAPIALRPSRCARLLGTVVEDYADLLQRIEVRPAGVDLWQPPTFRPDLTREVDLIEEICRLSGVDRIEGRVRGHAMPRSAADRAHEEISRLRQRLAGLGLSEARTLSLVDEAAVTESFEPDVPVWRLKNPLGDDGRVLRPSLVAGLLRAATRNFQRGAEGVALFEIGRIFRHEPGNEERTSLAVLLAGQRDGKRWDGEAAEFGFFDLKRAIETALRDHGPVELANVPPNALASLRCKISARGQAVGWCGQVRPSLARRQDLRGKVFVAEVCLGAAGHEARPSFLFRPLDRYPASSRDIALLARADLPYAAIEATLREVNEPLLVEHRLFDVFTDSAGVRVPADQKSVALSLTYRAPDRTLTQEEVAEAHRRVRDRLIERLRVTVRE